MRTKTKIVIAFFLAALSLSKAFSFNPEPVLESIWNGWAEQPTDLFEDGYASMSYQLYEVSYNSYTNSFTGKIISSINIDGTVYSSVVSINGSYDPSNFHIVMSSGSIYREDVLPGGLYWIHNDVEVTLYQDEENSAYYLLKGYAKDSYSYNSFSIEFSNMPDYLLN